MEGSGYEYQLTKQEIMDSIIEGTEKLVDGIQDGETVQINITISPECISMMSCKKNLSHPDKTIGLRMEEWE